MDQLTNIFWKVPEFIEYFTFKELCKFERINRTIKQMIRNNLPENHHWTLTCDCDKVTDDVTLELKIEQIKLSTNERITVFIQQYDIWTDSFIRRIFWNTRYAIDIEYLENIEQIFNNQNSTRILHNQSLLYKYRGHFEKISEGEWKRFVRKTIEFTTSTDIRYNI